MKMAIPLTYKQVLVVFTLTVASHMIHYYFNSYYKSKDKRIRKEINEVIMFSYDDVKLKKSKYSRCVITPSMDRLLYYLSSSRQSLDVCMYVLTNQDITNVLVKLIYRGVKIRVIIDADMAYSTGSTTKKLEKLGIPVRWMKSTNLMHHKFCLIDTIESEELTTPFVIMGSLNWTNQALSGNWEDVTVTSQPVLVQQYKEEFENLWVKFKPIVPH